jgi:chromate reductase, NAD(P)H dehydrogenase (quinone)
MITIISGSNREENNTHKVAKEYQRILAEKHGSTATIYPLERFSDNISEGVFKEAEKVFLVPAEKFIIIMPEYNGSYPGILKLMIDHSDVRKSWRHKKVLLVGISTGRAGNLRGMEHLTGVLLHMQMFVHPHRLPISLVDTLMNTEGQFVDATTLNMIDNQLADFLHF